MTDKVDAARESLDLALCAICGDYVAGGVEVHHVCAVHAIEEAAIRAESEATVAALDPMLLAEAYGQVMALAPDPYPTTTRWAVIASLYAALVATQEAER